MIDIENRLETRPPEAQSLELAALAVIRRTRASWRDEQSRQAPAGAPGSAAAAPAPETQGSIRRTRPSS